jgi:hypothetical protein
MNHESVLMLSVIRALKSDINICYSPQPASPSLITEDLQGRAAAGVYF